LCVHIQVGHNYIPGAFFSEGSLHSEHLQDASKEKTLQLTYTEKTLQILRLIPIQARTAY